MWKPPLTFITLHYAYIILLGILGVVILYPYGNLTALESYFFGVSASTESGLNTIDVKLLKTYQQLFVYIIPTISNIGFINIIVVVVRLYWFEKYLKEIAPKLLKASSQSHSTDCESQARDARNFGNFERAPSIPVKAGNVETPRLRDASVTNQINHEEKETQDTSAPGDKARKQTDATRITFEPESSRTHATTKEDINSCKNEEAGYPRDRRVNILSDDDGEITRINSLEAGPSALIRRRLQYGSTISQSKSIERVATSFFVLGTAPNPESQSKLVKSEPRRLDLPFISSQATIGRNSQFHNLTDEDREQLGGIEYRALKLLLKIIAGYFFGLHLFGAICLAAWIQNANPKYRDYLQECGQDKTWWGFYSAQTMVNNLGLTLTPDSMITFQDATFPMLLMTFLAFAGNTCYPVLLRLVVWTMSKLVPKTSSTKEALDFLLKHPRRCYTLLFPSRPTWILFGILFVLNFVDVLLIIVLDLHNTAVNNLPGGPRVLAALFQAASSRHTGTATFNLAEVHPAVQFSLLVMMYISVYPIAITVRASNTYEEKSLGIYHPEPEIDEKKGFAYVMNHLQNQLNFDLWYIFLGIFCICIAESDKIMDSGDPAFSVFPVFFEVVSAYGNVGLSLGHPTVLTSLSGEFTAFSKLVICATMIRGRHRGLPYQLDRAIMLPNKELSEEPISEYDMNARKFGKAIVKRSYTM